MQDNTYFSKKVSFLNAFLTCLIVVLHAKTPERWGLDLNWDIHSYTVSLHYAD